MFVVKSLIDKDITNVLKEHGYKEAMRLDECSNLYLCDTIGSEIKDYDQYGNLIPIVEKCTKKPNGGKVYFRFGAMGSSKSANALMVRFNYLSKNQPVILLKPSCENRDGKMITRSRIGLQGTCMLVEQFIERFTNDRNMPFTCIIIDECQFLTKEQVEFFTDVADYLNVPVICYGLKTDFKSELFEGSKRLLELADEIEEIPIVCWCGKKARFNARVIDGRVVYEGEQILLGGDESYTALCRKHYNNGQLE